jgi:chorismate mutase / prephenate dehydratase
VCESIEDMPNNVTRFFVVAREDARATGQDKTAAIFSTAHKAGALVDVLEVFKKYSVNLTNIESRPSKKREWEYYFFVDFLGHRGDENVQKAFNEARQHCLQLSVLGSFPKAVEILG